MRHNREEVIARTIREFELLDNLVAELSVEDWEKSLPRPETKDPWTVKDALAHITYWKANFAHSLKKQHLPAEESRLQETKSNRVIYLHWKDRSYQEVLERHRQTQEEVLSALREAPEEWFSSKQRRPEWPTDLDGHSATHRVNDIERALRAADEG